MQRRVLCAVVQSLFVMACCLFAPAAGSSPADPARGWVDVALSHAGEWSNEPEYLALDAWTLGAPLLPPLATQEPLNRTPEGDFRGFILGLAASRPSHGSTEADADQSTWCQEFTKVRFLRRRLGALGQGLPPSPHCPAFERWAQVSSLASVEILFVSPSGIRSAATFGHTMIRLVRDPAVAISGDDPVYEIVALTPLRSTALEYVAGGLSGKFPLVFQPTTWRSVAKVNLVDEQRNISRFTLSLTAAQRLRVAERLWEAERRAYLPYEFLAQNCAVGANWLLATALSAELDFPLPTDFIQTPAEALAALGRVRGTSGSRFVLSRTAVVEQATGARADAALDARDAAITRLGRRAPGLAARLRREPDALTVESYRLLEEDLRRADGRSPESIQISAATVEILRGRLDAVEGEVRHLEFGRITPVPGEPLPSLDALIEARRSLYAVEDERRREALLDARSKWATEYVNRAPRQPMSGAEASLRKRAGDLEAEFERVTEAHARLLDVLDALHGVEPAQDRPTTRRLVRSGASRLSLGHVLFPRGASRLRVNSAFWRESLGDDRPQGLGPWRALTLLESENDFSTGAGTPRWLGSTVVPIKLSVVEHRPSGPIREWFPRLGWSAETRMDGGLESARATALGSIVVLFADPVDRGWVVGASLGVGPGLAVAPELAGVTLVARGGLWATRRIGATGRAELAGAISDEPRLGLRTSSRAAVQYPMGESESTTWETWLGIDDARRARETWSVGFGLGF